MDPTGLSLGVISAVIQTYTAVTAAYDLYLEVKDFPSTFQELRMGLLIERYKLELWANHVLSDAEQDRVKRSSQDWGLWKLFESIFNKILEAFQEHNEIMENYGQHTGLPKKDGLSDWEFLENLSLSVKSPPKNKITRISRTIKFVLRDKRKMEQLIKQLNYWNDSLDKMTSKLDQESSRRKLRTYFSTDDATQLQYLEAAAALFNHQDLGRMASVRTLIDQGYRGEKSQDLEASLNPAPEYRLMMEHLQWQCIPYQTDQVRAMAKLGDENIIVDWRGCQDNTWRRENPSAFRRRTENLTKILNSDLRPLGISVLHCVGYLDQNINITGYAFRLPPDVPPGQNPMTLHQLLMRAKSANDIPDLGERFDLAKALTSTVFEIHNLGWVHKNIQPKNILFWPKPNTTDEPDLRKPYLMGFDISRPSQPGEVSEKPPSRPEDDLYRHPEYIGLNPQSFQPSFDLYSLGVILYEIGLWRNVAQQKHSSSLRPSLHTQKSDPQFVEKMVQSGSILELKRYTGLHFQNAVAACLSKDFDAFWAEPQGNRQQKLQAYLGQLQAEVVDAVAVCNA